MKTILITGALGYIGSSLIRHFKKRYYIIAVDNLMYNQSPLVYPILDGVEFHKLDVRNCRDMYPLINRADIVIPLAAIVGAPACDAKPDLAQEVNFDAIEDLIGYLECTDKHKNPTVVFPNTNSGYGNTGGKLCTEETPLKALSLYGDTKDKAEQVVMQYENSVAFRLATVFGYSPRMRLDLLVNTLVFEAVFNGNIKIFDDSFMRNYIHVQDICRAFEFAIDNIDKMRGQVYNLGNDRINMTKGDLVNTITKHLDVKVEKVSKTDPDQRNYEVSSAKLYSLGWSPSYDLDDGIEELIRYYTYNNLGWKQEWMADYTYITELMVNAGKPPLV